MFRVNQKSLAMRNALAVALAILDGFYCACQNKIVKLKGLSDRLVAIVLTKKDKSQLMNQLESFSAFGYFRKSIFLPVLFFFTLLYTVASF